MFLYVSPSCLICVTFLYRTTLTSETLNSFDDIILTSEELKNGHFQRRVYFHKKRQRNNQNKYSSSLPYTVSIEFRQMNPLR